MNAYNKRFLKKIRKALRLSQQEMSGRLGVQRACYASYELGRRNGGDFFFERMLEVFGIDMRQPAEMHRIVFDDPGKVRLDVYRYLSKLEIYDNG
ncbi:helix-turn-helix transcriptional regulator [Chitinophaga sp. 212800010-3]|uniref:helix-turn-helix domain-containing protein n=1 Tax=unclassified Chitinophaga TaxID=2619133 RepID=UPI002DF208A9|nr:HTH cro/C1-type domain-containing protein [Chitinophaga sp. 212800010-3]